MSGVAGELAEIWCNQRGQWGRWPSIYATREQHNCLYLDNTSWNLDPETLLAARVFIQHVMVG